MNQAQVNGKWEQIKGTAKQAWGKLTDDDFAKAEGSAEKLFGIIHEKFGDAKEAIHDKVHTESKWEQIKGSAKKAWAKLSDDDLEKAEGSAEKLLGIIHDKFGDAKDSVQDKVGNAKDKLVDAKDSMQDKLGDAKDSVQGITKNGSHAVGITLGLLFAASTVAIMVWLVRDSKE
jgi:uncharacterized protein YjbJ (UPF0337 family)